MKKFSLKFSFVFSLAIFTALFLSGFFTSCAADAESTKLVVNLGSNSRSALNASESNTAYYIVLVENDSESIEKRGDKGSVVVFEEIPVGTYTVKISAYDANDNLLASSTQTADVLQNKVCEVALSLKSGFRTNNDIWLWNVAGGYSGTDFLLKKFNVINKNTELGFVTGTTGYYTGADILNENVYNSSEYHSWAEDKEGRLYYICDNGNDEKSIGVRYKGDGVYWNDSGKADFEAKFSDSDFYSFYDPLYYDISDDIVIAAATISEDDELRVGVAKYSGEVNSGSMYVYSKGIVKFSGFDMAYAPAYGLAAAKKGENYYFSIYDNENEVCKLFRCRVTGEDDDGNEIGAVDAQISIVDIGLAGAFIDIAVLDDGSLYALAFQKDYKDGDVYPDEYKGIDLDKITEMSFPGFSSENNYIYYSRGAIVKFNDSEAGLSLDFSKGWTNLREMRASGNKEAAIEWVRGQADKIRPVEQGNLCLTYEPDRLMAAFPSADERDSAFFGPMKIVAIKPKELYIVDSGVSIKLADWDSKKTGGYFGHDRVMKFDLENFALSCVRDETVPLFINDFNGSNTFEKNKRMTNFLKINEIYISGNAGFGKYAYDDDDPSRIFITPAFEE